MKESSGDARRIAAVIGPRHGGRMEVVAGTDDIALESFCAGATGWVTGCGDVAPAECVELWRLLEARELRGRAGRSGFGCCRSSRLDTHPKLVQFYKASLDQIGKYGGPTPPAAPAAHGGRAPAVVVDALDALWGEGARPNSAAATPSRPATAPANTSRLRPTR